VELSVGIMNVVKDVGTDMDDTRDPTWEEALAEFNDALPVELERSPRKITVVYRFTGGGFAATSPDLRGFRVTGRTLREVKAAARHDLQGFLDPAVEVVEREPVSEPRICTSAATTRDGWLVSGALPAVIVLTSSGSAGTFVSSARTSRRKARVS
jgi:hypothetical protein